MAESLRFKGKRKIPNEYVDLEKTLIHLNPRLC